MAAVRLILISALAAATLALSSCSHSRPCEDVIAWAPGSDKIDIPKNDRLFICGDPDSHAWKRIPQNQAASALRSYLESQGYLAPKIEPDYEARKLLVDIGRKSKIEKMVTAEPTPGFWSQAPLETHLGSPLTKKTLDRIQADATALLQENGYPCAKVQLRATPEGEVEIRLFPGDPLPFTDVTDLADYPLKARILKRYEAFTPGEPFDIRKLTLSGRRIESDAVASGATYMARCKVPVGTETGVTESASASAPTPTPSPSEIPMRVERSLSLAAKRLWEFGIGASTEEYPIGTAKWKNSRLWGSASKFEASLFGSNIRQRLMFDLRWFHSESDVRRYLRPNLKFEHRKERNYETFETTASLREGRLIDVGSWRLIPEAGAALRRIRVIDSAAPNAPTRTDTLVSPGFTVEAQSNQYELYAQNPRSGLMAQLDYDFIGQGLGAKVSAHRFAVSGTALYNFKAYRDPKWILGLRYLVGSILVAGGGYADPAAIPPDWFFLAGGDQNIRGFGRNALPLNSVGAGAMAYGGIESRWPGLFSFPLEPLVFFDVAKLGTGNMSLISPLLLSPGFGFRSGTPIGTVRATLARGIALSTPVQRRWQLFVSLGTEF
jgi:translocation and assembly module TamA